VVGNIDSIKRIKRCIQQVGLTIRDIVLEPLASSDAVLYDEEREAGVALVDIGGGTTDVAVFHDKVLRHSAVIPFGGYAVTKDLKIELGLNEQTAEDVKIQFGAAMSESAEENKVIVIPSKIPGREPKEISFRNLANIIQARMEEIIDGIMFEIENSGCADKLGCGIVITGGGAMLRHLKELFRFRTGKDVRIGYPGEHLVGEADNINEPCYATGVGLLIKGFEYIDEHEEEIKDDDHSENPIPQPEEVKIEHVSKPVEDVMKKIKKPRKPFSFEKFIDRVGKYFDAEPDSPMEKEVRKMEKEKAVK